MLLSMQNVAKKVRCWHPVSLPVGALMGVVSAAMRFGGINLVNDAWVNNTWSEVLALGAYALLIIYFIKASMKTK